MDAHGSMEVSLILMILIHYIINLLKVGVLFACSCLFVCLFLCLFVSLLLCLFHLLTDLVKLFEPSFCYRRVVCAFLHWASRSKSLIQFCTV